MLEKININIWDDYEDGGDTYLYYEGSEEPLLVQMFALEIMSRHIKKDFIIECKVRVFDSYKAYPALKEQRIPNFTRAELVLYNLKHETKDKLVDYLNNFPLLNVYSES